jgi:hypothetical protein
MREWAIEREEGDRMLQMSLSACLIELLLLLRRTMPDLPTITKCAH